MRGLIAIAAVCGACGDNLMYIPPDAPEEIDAPKIGDAPDHVTYRYVIDRQIIPKNNAEARDLGLDLDADGVVDNQLGQVMAALTGMGFDVQAPTDRAIDRGRILMLAELSTNFFLGGNTGTFTLYSGADPMPAPCADASDMVCRRHLTGTGSFTVAATSAHDPPLPGGVISGTFLGGPGRLQVQGTLSDAPPIAIDLIGARARLVGITDGTLPMGVVAGAVTPAEIDEQIIPAIESQWAAIIATDCTMLSSPPGCGCAVGSNGRAIIQMFDVSPQDCAVSQTEIKNNQLVSSLLAPDVMIDGQPALSFGIGIRAVKATYMP